MICDRSEREGLQDGSWRVASIKRQETEPEATEMKMLKFSLGVARIKNVCRQASYLQQG